ncbi:MAG: RsmB/NOP family class I SAM-dependent RNA methyltransferase [Candidatus Pacearchaeota archaeon]
MGKNYELKPFFVERMKQLLPDEKDFQSYLEILKHEPVRSIRCNTLKISPNKLKKILEEKNWKISQPWKNHPEVMIVEGKYINRELQINMAPKSTSSDFSAKNIISAKKNFKQCSANLNSTSSNKQDISRSNYVNNLKNPTNEVSNTCLGWTNVRDLTNLKTIKTNRGRELGGNNSSQKNKILVNLEPGELGRSLEHLIGYYYIQELASMLPTIALDVKEGELVLDLAASPGSKTTQMSASMNNTGTIIANEVSLGRIKILASNLERCGVTNCIITRKDGVAFCERIKKYMRLPSEASKEVAVQELEESRRKPTGCLQFDKILVDAPCSGEGTLRSTPKTYQMWNPKTIFNLSRLQKSLVASAIEILKPNGVLVYSTCTHAPEENEEVVDFILEKFPEIKIEKIELPINCRKGITEWNTSTKKYDDTSKDNIINNNFNLKLKDISHINNSLSGGRGGDGDGKENLERNKQIKRFSPEVNKSCRIYPHDANTEGFFIAKFKKIK